MWNQNNTCSVQTPVITRSDWTVAGWNTLNNANNATNATTGASISITIGSDQTFYVISSRALTATFNANGATLSGNSVNCTMWNQNTNCNVQTPVITRGGDWTILGWNSAATNETANHTTTGGAISITLTANATFYAISRNDVTITFNANGATSIGQNSLSCSYFNTATSCNLVAPTITRVHHYLIGWNTTNNATTSQWNVGNTRAVSENQTWYAITNHFCNTFNAIQQATGGMGGTNPAPWVLCDNGRVIISGGTANTGSGTLNQSHFPATYRPDIEIIEFRETVIGGPNLYDIFRDLPNLTNIENLNRLDTTNTLRFTRMFAHTPSLISVDLSSWNTSNLQIMYRMFYTSGVQTVNLGGSFNPVNVTNMGSMFWHNNQLTTIEGISGWNTGNVTRMSRMFQGANSLQTLNLTNWDVSSVQQTYHMFSGAHSLTSVGNLANWNVSSVTNMNNMFANTWALTTIGDVGNWNVSNVTNMNSMFFHARSITSLNFSNWDTTHMTGNNMNVMLGRTDSLRDITFGEHWWVPTLGSPSSNLSIPAVANDANFTGFWRNVGAGTVNNPLGTITVTSANLGNNSLGADIANRWVWEPQ